MTTTTANAQPSVAVSKLNIEAMQSNLDEQTAMGLQSLEFELRKERLDPYRIDITKHYQEPTPMVTIDNCCVCSAGNISAIVGESKSKKTFLATAIIASAFAYPLKGSPAFKNISNNAELSVLWFDTEQGEAHVRKVINRINTITGTSRIGGEDPRLNVYALRELDPKERRALLYDALYTHSPNIVVIDGVADLQYDTNDLRESEALVGELMALSTGYNCHIMCILHTNPGTDKARGHVGSALQRKAESVLYVHRVDDVSIVEPQFCRNEPFERFAFRVNADGIPQLCELPTQGGDSNSEVCQLLSAHFGGSVERKVLTYKLIECYNLSKDSARMRIRRALDCGVIVQRGNIISLPTAAQMPETEAITTTTAATPAVEPQSTAIADIFPNKPARCPADWEDDVPF